MKNKTIVRRYVPQAATLRAAKELQNLRCQGLRPYSIQGSAGGLRMAERPVTILGDNDYVPLVELAAEDGMALILKRGESLGVLMPGQSAVRRLVEVNIGGEAMCALRDPDNPAAAIVMVRDSTGEPERGVLRLRDGVASWRSASRPWPVLTFTAEDCGSQSAACGRRKVTESYAGASQVSAADARGLSDELTDTYERLVSGAHASGCAVQPMLMRYRLLDAGGHVLHESPVHYLEHPTHNGSQLTDAVTIGIESGSSMTGEYEITARVWRPVLDIPAGMPGEVAAVEVVATPEFHPLRPDAASEAYVSRRGQEQEFRVSLPGSQAGIRPAPGYGRARLCRVAGDMARVERRLALVATGDGAARRVVLNPGFGAGTAKEDAAVLEKVHSGTVTSRASEPACRRLTAGLVARRADIIVWGNVEMKPFEGWSMEELCAERDSDDSVNWQALVKVEFADGTSVERRSSGRGSAPLRLRPLAGYPDVSARRMRLWLVAGERSYSGTLELTPDAAGKMALWLDAGLKGVTLSGGNITGLPLYSLSSARREIMPEALAVCRASAPTEPLMILRCGSGEVTALSACAAGAQTWDFGRQRFVAGTSRGLYMLSCTDSRHWLRLLDGGAVLRPDALACAGEEGTYAVGGGRLLHIDRRGHCGVVSELEEPGTFVAWLPRLRQLLLDEGRFYDPEAGTLLNLLPYKSVSSVPCCGAGNEEVWLLRANGDLLRAGAPGDVEQAALCVWSGVIEAPEGMKPRALLLNMSATELKATLRVEIPRDGAAAIPVYTGEIAGAVRGPLRVRLRGRFTLRRGLSVTLMLTTASADFVFRSLSVEYDRE